MNKNNKYGLMLFLEGDDDNASGGGAPASATQDPWETDGPEGTNPEPTPEPTPTPEPAAPSAAPAFDYDKFGQALGNTLSQHQQQQQQNRPPTPEEIAQARKELNFLEIDDDFVKKFGNLETQKAAFEQFRDGMARFIFTAMNRFRQEDRGFVEQRFTPLQALIEEREVKERETRFGARFPDFAGEEMQPYVEAAISQLAAKKAFEGKKEPEIFKLVAEHLTAAAKKFNPSFTLRDASTNGASPNSRQGNGIPVTSGGTGASRGGGPAPTKKSWALTHMK